MRTKITATALTICVLSSTANAQFFDRIKNKVQQKVESTIDKSLSGKKKTDVPPVPVPDNSAVQTNGTADQDDIKAYSKFDFVPGEKIIVEENFSQDAIGEFPEKWNTKTSAEVVTLNNKPGKWLALKQDGVFFPEYITNLPDNFTLQLEVLVNNSISNIGTLTVALAAVKDDNDKFDTGYSNSNIRVPGIKLDLRPQSEGYQGNMGYSTNALGASSIDNISNEFHAPGKTSATISIWRQKQRVRVYLNSTKLLDLPRALELGTVINSLIFGAYAPDYDKKGGSFYISNIRLAIGAADTRNKLITEGKFVTNGILFDVNNDHIKPQSNGALQDIANVLKENSTARIKIVGHTDADGDDKINLDLSKRRADAVKAILVSTFSIDAARLETDGKGKTQPIQSNETAIGKANNRRVEFIKL